MQKPTSGARNFELIPEQRPDLLRSGSRAEFERFMSRTHSLVTARNINVPQER